MVRSNLRWYPCSQELPLDSARQEGGITVYPLIFGWEGSIPQHTWWGLHQIYARPYRPYDPHNSVPGTQILIVKTYGSP